MSPSARWRVSHEIAFTCSAAIAIGFAATAFAVAGKLLQPLRLERADDLVAVAFRTADDGGDGRTSYANFADSKHEARQVALAAYMAESFHLYGAAEPIRVEGAEVTASFLPVLRLPLLMGSGFGMRAGGGTRADVVVINESLWRTSFGGDPQVIGKRVRLDALGGLQRSGVYEIVGVVRAGGEFPAGSALWIPHELPEELQAMRPGRWLSVVGRLEPGVSAASAGEELSRVAVGLSGTHPSLEDMTIRLTGLGSQAIRAIRPAALVLAWAALAIMALSLLNILILVVARDSQRERETAVRLALGATPSQLARGSLVEYASRATLVGGVGGFATWVAGKLLEGGVPTMTDGMRVSVGFPAIGIGVSIVVAVAFGARLFALARAGRSGTGLRSHSEGSAFTAGHRSRVFWRSVLVAEFALTVLLSGLAIVLHQEIRRLGRVDLGFDPTDVVGIQITLPKTGYSTPQRRRAFYSEVLAGAVGWSGGKTAAIGEVLAEGGPRFTFEQAEPVGHVEPRAALVIPVSSGFFDVISASLRPGEGAARGVRGAVVGRKIADHYWGSQQVVGRRIRFGGDQPGWWTVVGVVDDIRHGGPTAEAPPTIYLDLWHLPPLETMLLVRSTGGTQPAIAAALALLRRIDDDVVVGEAGPLSSLLEARNEPLRLAAVLAAVLAVVGLAMAGAGVLGVFSLGAHQRLKALAIRSALGAEGRHLVGVLLYEACLVCGLGVVMGSLLAGGAHHVGARLWPGHSIPLLVPVGLGSGMAALAVLLSSLNMLRAAAAVDPARLLRRT